MDTNVIGAAVVGASGVGRIHVDALRRIGVNVAAVVGSSRESAERTAAELRVPVACASVEEAVGRSDVDAVHICSPNALHVDQVTVAIEAGKHVLCEKPLTTTSADAERLLRLADDRGIVHGTAYTYRYYMMVHALRGLVAAGDLGRVHAIRGVYLDPELLLFDDPDAWLLDPALAGPALALSNTGVHWWDLVEFTSGQRITSVLADTHVVHSLATAAEDTATIMLRLDGGAVANAVISSAAPGHGNTIQIETIGTQASARWEQEDPERLWLGVLGKPEQRLARPDSLDESCVPGTYQAWPGHPQGYFDAFRDLIADFYRAVDGHDTPSRPTFADGYRGIRVLEALLQSAAAGGTWSEVAADPA